VATNKFNLVQVQVGPPESPTLLPECAIAALGAGLLHYPNYEVTPASALAGGVAAILAVLAGCGVSHWVCWAQIVLGFAIAFLPIFLRLSAVGKADWVALFAGLLIALLADVQLECGKDAEERSQRRGWRAPSPIPGRGPRLVYSSEHRSDGTRTRPNDCGTDHVA
jgi:hypothetical protein